MIEKDYLLRIIQQFVETILRLLRLIKNNNEEIFLVEFNEFLLKNVNLKIDSLLDLEIEDIQAIFYNIVGYENTSQHLKILFLSCYNLLEMEELKRNKLVLIGLELNTFNSVFDFNTVNEIYKLIQRITSEETYFTKYYEQLIKFHIANFKSENFENELFFHAEGGIIDKQVLSKIANLFYSTLAGLSNENLLRQGFNYEELKESKVSIDKIIYS